jgi:hypothetical protein
MTAQAAASTTAAAPPSNSPPAPSSAAGNNDKASRADEAAGNSRLPNTTAVLPLVYGSIAFYLGKQADEFQTHEWTLFVRGPNNEDLSPVVAKVVFQLHASFAQPSREYTQPPFEVTEKGWGEFEAQIRIHWKDPTEKATIVSQTRTLYFGGENVAAFAHRLHPAPAIFFRSIMESDFIPRVPLQMLCY